MLLQRGGSYLLDKTPVPVHCGTDFHFPFNFSRSLDFSIKYPKTDRSGLPRLRLTARGLSIFRQPPYRAKGVYMGSGRRRMGTGRNFIKPRQIVYRNTSRACPHSASGISPWRRWKISWIEGYFAADCKPSDIHGDWNFAQKVIESEINKHVNLQNADSELLKIFPDKKNDRKIVMQGSGWGYIENLMRKS